ncbi:MAG: ferrous iron transport protein B [bacterium]|nr:ferrous iron transport protein B [bacterium]
MRHQRLSHRPASGGSRTDHRQTAELIEPKSLSRPASRTIYVALIGNPNAGKSTIFNALTGSRQHVGNWPGVTVEKKEGTCRSQNRTLKITDLPGTYSLTAFSIEEKIVRDFLLNGLPEVIVQVVDGSNLERNLYLTVQLIELGLPLVMALNMYDELQDKGLEVNTELLEQLLGCRIIPTIGSKGYGVKPLVKAITDAADDHHQVEREIRINYGLEVEKAISELELGIPPLDVSELPPRYAALRLLEGDNDIMAAFISESSPDLNLSGILERSIDHLNKIYPEGVEAVIADRRYGFIAGAIQETVRRTSLGRREFTEKIDAVLTHRILGIPLFLAFLWLLFQGTFTLGAIPMEWIEVGVMKLGSTANSMLPSGPLASLIADGIIGGVGGVLVFLPNILILFLGISILEDTGYMARAAFLMDKVMHSIGLHGKSFIPLIMGFGCNIPAIMAARTLESRRDRLLTILITPLMSCSARLPVYILFAGVFFPNRAGDVVFGLYLFGVLMAMLIGKLLSVTLFKAKGAPFVMELPPYRVPTAYASLRHMWDRASQYLRKMGTVILAASILVWFLGAFPQRQGNPPPPADSYIGQIGQALQPVLKPLGFNWEMGVALLSGLIAKEVVISTMGVLYGTDHLDETQRIAALPQALKMSGITPLAALAFMIFVLLYSPCVPAIVAIWKETRSLRWTIFSVGYQSILAWTIAFIAVKSGTLLGLA